MIENLADFINAMLLQHPHLLRLMRTLFWVKYWALTGIMGVFIGLVYFGDQRNDVPKGKPDEQTEKRIFIA